MAGKSIYPSIPAPGNDLPSIRATLNALRQSMTMITMNAQAPSANFTPSSASQVFVTKDDLKAAGVQGDTGPAGPQGPPGPGIPEAPNDVNTYGRSALSWQPVLPLAGGTMTGTLGFAIPSGGLSGIGGILAGVQQWLIIFHSTPNELQFYNAAGTKVMWIGQDGIVHFNSPIVIGP